ncbi:MAG: DNA-directed RNA polymerase subunit L [Nanoarchaeota archaeon]|nr:DNA-directed RNA polymerase subunit L [Nanoarchaeota archaeon]
MEIDVVDDKKNRFVFEIEGMGHTYLNILKNELWNDSHVKVATYAIKHPQVSKPKFILETDGDASPRAALGSAVGRLKKLTERFKKEMSAIR